MASYECVLRSLVSRNLLLTFGIGSFTTLEEHIKSLNDEAAALAAAEIGKMEIKESKSSATEKTNGKKRKTASTGVEKLKKVNTKGMAKLSTFFQPKAL